MKKLFQIASFLTIVTLSGPAFAWVSKSCSSMGFSVGSSTADCGTIYSQNGGEGSPSGTGYAYECSLPTGTLCWCGTVPCASGGGVCNSYVNDISNAQAWTSASASVEQKNSYTPVGNSNCTGSYTSSTSYRCKANYYGSPTSASGTCTACPCNGTSSVGTTAVGSCTADCTSPQTCSPTPLTSASVCSSPCTCSCTDARTSAGSACSSASCTPAGPVSSGQS
ncbi:MAG: hypothetical protein FWC61_02895, partial [Proteobacteria bacterium]|nr:hypothetical protein [Pseudomonadota bacterium]